MKRFIIVALAILAILIGIILVGSLFLVTDDVVIIGSGVIYEWYLLRL